MIQKEFNNLMKSRKRLSILNHKKIHKRQFDTKLPEHLQQKMEDYQGSYTIGISKSEFIELIANVVPNMSSRSNELFTHFDEDGSGYLDFREFIIAMSVLSKGDFEDKLRICFYSYDITNTGYLLDDEFHMLIQNILDPYTKNLENDPKELQEITSKVHSKMLLLSENYSGKVSFGDFLNGIKSDMFLYNTLCEHIGTSDKAQVISIMKAMKARAYVSEDTIDLFHCKICEIM